MRLYVTSYDASRISKPTSHTMEHTHFYRTVNPFPTMIVCPVEVLDLTVGKTLSERRISDERGAARIPKTERFLYTLV